MSEAIDSMPGKLDALSVRVGALDAKITDHINEEGSQLAENTVLTRGIARQLEAMAPKLEEMHAEYKAVYVPVKTTGSVITSIAVWGGKIALAVSASIGAVAAFLHLNGGK